MGETEEWIMTKWKIWDQGIGGMDHGRKGEYGIKESEEWIMGERENMGETEEWIMTKWKIWDQGIGGMDHGQKGEYGRNGGMDHDEMEDMGSRIQRNGSWAKWKI